MPAAFGEPTNLALGDVAPPEPPPVPPVPPPVPPVPPPVPPVPPPVPPVPPPVPPPVGAGVEFRSTVTAALGPYPPAVAMSGRPSPLRSPTTIDGYCE